MSNRSRSFTTVLCVLGAILFSAALSTTAGAQAGRISGTVTDSSRAPLVGAQVTLSGARSRAITDSGGVVRQNEDTHVDVTLPRAALTLAGMVVSASRRPEKITDAPATITRIDASAIENTVGNSFAPALKAVKGLDYIQVGVTAVAVNARGFNSSFNNRMLMMEDNRIAVLPENGLPVGAFTPLPKLDLAGIEVLVGPGSALYGPDASNGVITLQSKDPRDYPGASLEVAGGSKSFYDIQGRYAGVANGRIGYKLSAEYQSAKDWQNKNIYAPIVTGGPVSPEIGADWNTNVMRNQEQWNLSDQRRPEPAHQLAVSRGAGQVLAPELVRTGLSHTIAVG